MRKIFNIMFAMYLISNSAVAFAVEKTHFDKIGLVGSYKCSGYDNYDGPITGIVTYTLDEGASDLEHNFGAYKFTNDIYSGFIAAQGTILAYYFENNNHKDATALTDRGVGIATITYDQNEKGKFIISLHSSYFQPYYKRDAKDGRGAGGHGTAVCVKINADH